jgi:NADH-quinone oxidoreductase subunit M
MSESFPLLSLLVFLPAGGIPLILLFRRQPERCRRLALWITGGTLLLAAAILVSCAGSGSAGLCRFSENAAWIESLGIRYSLRADGINLLLALLTTLLCFLCVLVSWRSINTEVGLFHAALLLMETSVLGIFLAADLFLFYLFWELQLLPTFLIIGRWGHANRTYAALKFLLFSIAGSLPLLIALISLYLVHASQTGIYTFSFSALRHTALSPTVEFWLFAGFLVAFAVKIPMIPIHVWLPDAHTEAPTAGSVLLAGLLLKTGAYALLRYAIPLFPGVAAAFVPLLVLLALTGLFYASFIAFAQTDMKRLVAYSSIGHMGLVVLGIVIWNRITLSGAVLQMVNHGLTTSALFIMVGMLDERIHSRRLADVGGLWQTMPLFSGFFMLFGLSAIGLPGLNNFVSEMLILIGAFDSHPAAACFGFAAMVLTLAYILRLLQQLLFGPAVPAGGLADLDLRETCILLPLALAVVFIGWHPQPLLELLREPVRLLLYPPEQMLAAIGVLQP